MTLLHTLFAFIVTLGTLVIVHELGHYWVARWCGVKVLRFSVGMGKVIFSRKFGPDQTEWAISILPLGGYVKMLDAREQDQKDLSAEDLKREFTSQSVGKRIAIVAAGPIANFLLAIAVFAGLYMHGIPEPIPKLRAVSEHTAAYKAGLRGGELITAVNGEPIRIWSDVRWHLIPLAVEKMSVKLDVEIQNTTQSEGKIVRSVTLSLEGLDAKDLEGDFLAKLGLDLARPKAILGAVAPDGPAMRAGLKEGDWIQQIDGVEIHDGLSLVELIRASAGKPLQIRGLRGQQEFELIVIPQGQEQDGKLVGRINVQVPLAPEMTISSESPFSAVIKGVQKTWDTSTLTLKMLGKMLVGELSWKNITGPITIADYAGQTARIGTVSFLSFIAFISISLGVMNLLPIPVLDGGLLLYYALEVLTGRPVSKRFGEIAQRAGLAILMSLMVVAVFNDIVRLMS